MVPGVRTLAPTRPPVRAPGGGPVAALALLLASSGCSLVFDGDDFLFADAGVPDARVYPDVDPSGLSLTAIEPAVLEEGAGCVPDGDGCGAASRPMPFVLRGTNIAGDATITLSGGGLDGPVDATVSDAGDLIAFAIPSPVRPDLAAGDEEAITVTVAQGPYQDEQTLLLRGLGELALPDDCPDSAEVPRPCDAGDVSGRYATVHVTGDVRVTGTVPLVLEATAEIALGGVLVATGAPPPSRTTGGPAGPGGCEGAGFGSAAPCGDGSGGAGGVEGGGGGGGNGTMGVTGGGAAGGSPGAAAGPTHLTPLADSGGRGGGGGGRKEAGLLASQGGAGGGGGGVVALTAHGRLRIEAGGGVTVDGGDGGLSDGDCGALSTTHPGDGGGGSGGAVLLRAALALVDDGSGGERLRAAGGSGGASGGGCQPGGAGGDGLVRVDGPAPAPLPGLSPQSLYRGPVLAPSLPPIATEAALAVDVVGAVGSVYLVEGEGDPIEVDTDDDHEASTTVELVPGHNRVCAKVGAAAGPSTTEGMQCHDVVYIPRSR